MVEAAEQKKVGQKKFATLEAFVEGLGNFQAHFQEGNEGDLRRALPHFQRFLEKHKDLAKDLIGKIDPKGKIPYDKLYKAYKHMSDLVYEGDQGLTEYKGQQDEYLVS
jgi:hypothetical protein